MKNLVDHVRATIIAAERDGLTIDDGNVIDLLCDNLPQSIGVLRGALVEAGYAERFPRACALRERG